MGAGADDATGGGASGNGSGVDGTDTSGSNGSASNGSMGSASGGGSDGSGSAGGGDGSASGGSGQGSPNGSGSNDGSSSGSGSTGGSASAVDCEGDIDVGTGVLRRLTRLEYQLTLRELFQLDATPEVVAVPEDSDFKGFRTLAELQNVTTEHLRAYMEEASALADDLLSDSARAQAVIGCELATDGCLESFITDFGRVAYRRTLSSDDVGALLDVASVTGGSPEEQFNAVVSAMLSSPSFLFRAEIGDSPEGLSTLTGEELASRLSFTLIGRGPSRELLERGASGELDSEAGLLSAAQELLADPRAQEYFHAFFKQWLDFEQLRAPNEPGPGWNDSIMLSMTEETERFLGEYAWGSNVNFLDSLTANHTYIRADLAEFYDLPAPAADGRVEFPEGHNRAHSGLLTHASLVSAKGDGDRIAHRGAWVQKTFLCMELEVPAALLDEFSDELDGLTYQQMLDMRNSTPQCAGCHAAIDPIGVGFAQYDAAGQFDTSVDPAQFGITPALPGGEEFSTIGGLAAQLRERADVVSHCLTDRLFLFTDGRLVQPQDNCSVERAAERFAGEQYRFASILEGLVTSQRFRLRRAPEVSN